MHAHGMPIVCTIETMYLFLEVQWKVILDNFKLACCVSENFTKLTMNYRFNLIIPFTEPPEDLLI